MSDTKHRVPLQILADAFCETRVAAQYSHGYQSWYANIAALKSLINEAEIELAYAQSELEQRRERREAFLAENPSSRQDYDE